MPAKSTHPNCKAHEYDQWRSRNLVCLCHKDMKTFFSYWLELQEVHCSYWSIVELFDYGIAFEK